MCGADAGRSTNLFRGQALDLGGQHAGGCGRDSDSRVGSARESREPDSERVPGGERHPGPEREQDAGGLPGLVRLELDGEG